jgi:hypothetical protein
MQQENGYGGFGGVAPHRPFTYGSGGTAKTSNLRDVPIPDSSDASTVGMGTVGRGGFMGAGGGRGMNDSSFEDFYGELSFHPRRNYRSPMLRSRKFRRCCFCSVLGIAVLGVMAGVLNSRGKRPGRQRQGCQREWRRRNRDRDAGRHHGVGRR